MQIREQTAYDLFVSAHANYTGKAQQEVAEKITPEQFEERLRTLHRQYMMGEFSMGKFTELIGVPHLELWEILETLELAVHN